MNKNKTQKEVLSEQYMESEENILNLFVRTLNRIWQIRKYLFKVAVIGAFCGLIISISLPKQYLVSITLAPEARSKSDAGLASMAASFLGGNIPTSGGDALNALLTPQILSSTPFLLELLEMKVVNEEGVDTTFSAYLESESEPWWKAILRLPSTAVQKVKNLFSSQTEEPMMSRAEGNLLYLSSKQKSQIASLRESIYAIIDKKTSMITLNVTLQDPMTTALVADSVVSKIQKYLLNYKISKAKEDCMYWERMYVETKENYYDIQQKYAQFVDANSNMILQSTMVEKERLQNDMSLAYQVYTQVAQQLQMAKAKVQESKTVFSVLEPAVVPSSPTNMGKMKMMITFAILFLFCAIGWEICVKGFVCTMKELF